MASVRGQLTDALVNSTPYGGKGYVKGNVANPSPVVAKMGPPETELAGSPMPAPTPNGKKNNAVSL